MAESPITVEQKEGNEVKQQGQFRTMISYFKDNSEQELLISRTIQNKDISYQGQFRQEHLITRKILNEDNILGQFRQEHLITRKILNEDISYQGQFRQEHLITRKILNEDNF